MTFIRRLPILSLLPLLLHLGFALYYRLSDKIAMASPQGDPGYWNIWWQTLEYHLLREKLWESLWNLHMQPPLYNLYGAIFLNYFPDDYLSAMHYANIGLGALMCGMVYPILYSLTQRKPLALITALVLALNPALFLFEAHPLYTILTAFFVTLAIFCLALYGLRRREGLLYGFILGLNLVMLTRSSYHLLLLLPALVIVGALAEKHWRRVVLISLLISTLTVGWYAKNQVKFGFFGATSWTGFNLFKAAAANYSEEEIRQLGWEGVLGRPFQDFPIYFQQPDKFWLYGLYTKTSEIEALSIPDPNNINTPDIARMYGENAIRLIKYDPQHYLNNVIKAYDIYTRPSSQYGEIWHFALNIQTHERIADEWLQGQKLIHQISRWLGYDWRGSLLYFLLPICVLGYLGGLIGRNRLSRGRWLASLRADAVLIFLTILFLYCVLVSSVAEYGENNRFKFEVETVMAIYGVTLGYRLWQRFIAAASASPPVPETQSTNPSTAGR